MVVGQDGKIGSIQNQPVSIGNTHHVIYQNVAPYTNNEMGLHASANTNDLDEDQLTRYW